MVLALVDALLLSCRGRRVIRNEALLGAKSCRPDVAPRREGSGMDCQSFRPGLHRLVAPLANPGGTTIMTDTVAAEQLRLFIERIERLEEEKKGMADDIRDVYAEAKSQGYDSKTMRAIVRLRKMEKHARDEAEALLETYKAALGLG